jgi:hypothetical protein
MIANVPMMEAGTATKGIKVARGSRRNRNTTSTTSATESSSVRSMSDTDARIVWVWSRPMLMMMAGSILAASCGNAALMASTVLMMFAPGCLKMMSSAAFLPFANPVESTDWTES